MKVLVVGASGTIGRLVIKELAPRHEIIEAGKNQGQYQVDITSEDSVRQLFNQVGKVAMQSLPSPVTCIGVHSRK
jgi:dTDP-4-dehydrorhamnose reductase